MKFCETEEYADDLINGILYCHRVKEFREKEKNQLEKLRGDSLEGSSFIYDSDDGYLMIGTDLGEVKIPYLTASLTVSKKSEELKPIYCMFSLNSDFINKKCTVDIENKSIYIFSEELKKFGDYCVIIKDIEEFKSRIINYGRNNQIGINGNLVNYVNTKNYIGDWNIFNKSTEYEFQSEYRIAFNNQIETPFIEYDIGNLSDITIKIKTKDLDKMYFRDHNSGILFNLKWR